MFTTESKVQTRSGFPARILAVDVRRADGEPRIAVALTMPTGDEIVGMRRRDGRVNAGQDHPDDIVLSPASLSRHLVLTRNRAGELVMYTYDDETRYDPAHFLRSGTTVLARKNVTITEGEGL